jgi:hypothetical protein
MTKTEIINKALTLVGANPVISIDDDSNNARVLKRVYDLSLRSILSECKWNFATKRAALTLTSDTLAFNDIGEVFVYQKPLDMIRIYGVSPEYASWREEGEQIISNTSTLALRYVYYLDVPSKYPIYFIEAFIDKLAGDVAYSIVNSGSMAELFVKKYNDLSLPKAMSHNSQTGVQQSMDDSAWILAKYNDIQVRS